MRPGGDTLATRVVSRATRILVTFAQSVRRSIWFFTRPLTFGVDAIAITPEGKVILARLTYAKGWHLPGGGCKKREPALEAVRRELKEEVGMLAHGEIALVGTFSQRKDFKHDNISVFLVRGVRYKPKWSLEVEAVEEFELDRLPPDARHAVKWVAEAKQRGLL
jgi:8-oxo-dGTP pyrophosphatase MutT (NUDIX family)